MFCRFCGAQLLANSLFCAHCGKRLSAAPVAAENRLVRKLRLKTPYPWAALLLVLFFGWALLPDSVATDFSTITLELELQAESSTPEEAIFRHYLSLVVENVGETPIRDIPVELHATVIPEQPVEVVSEFRGGRFIVLSDADARPITLILSDEIAAHEKRRFPIDSIVTTQPPAEVTYTLVLEGSSEVLASLSAPIGEPPAQDGPLAFIGQLATFGQP